MDNVYGKMSIGTPLKSYIKRSLGKVHVKVWDQFSESVQNVILEGDPRKPDESCIVDVFSEKEDIFFRKSNSKHFQGGELVEYVRKQRVETVEEKINSMTDEEMRVLVAKPFLAIQNAVKKFTSIPALYALLETARELERSESIINLITDRISQLQREEYDTLSPTEE